MIPTRASVAHIAIELKIDLEIELEIDLEHIDFKGCLFRFSGGLRSGGNCGCGGASSGAHAEQENADCFAEQLVCRLAVFHFDPGAEGGQSTLGADDCVYDGMEG